MQWISVKDRLPKNKGDYLTGMFFEGYKRVQQVRYFDGDNFHNQEQFNQVTHWMSLPNEPKQEERDE